ncbi:MAG: HesA/MoeB/ThiF family protein [Balneolales bacterium]
MTRYDRHLQLEGFGPSAQKRLARARVLVIGAGGLGSPALQYLAAAGVGTLVVIDDDRVELSNLQRQVLYETADVGKKKAVVAVEKIKALNPDVDARGLDVRFGADNARELVEASDVIVDGTDNFATRYLANDACVLYGKPNVFAGVYQFEGQLSVFNYTGPDGETGPNYRDVFPGPPPPGLMPNCAEAGVLGALTGVMGSLQALEVIKICAGVGTPLSGTMLYMDSATLEMTRMKITKNPDNPLRGDPPAITGLDQEPLYNPPGGLFSVSSAELNEQLTSGRPVQLIDVREPHQHRQFNIGGVNIPLGQLEDADLPPASGQVTILYCQGGSRSLQGLQLLKNRNPDREACHLEGGMDAWQKTFPT